MSSCQHSLLFQFLLFIVFKSAMLNMALQLSPVEVKYSVQPHSIYYPNGPADVIYFSGSTIEFTCDVFCEHSCESLLFYNKSFPLIHDNIFGVPLEYQLYNSGHPAKVTLKIINATASSAGSYQCLTEAWNNTYIANKERRFQMAVLGTTKQEIKFVSNGDSVFLPCDVNASNNIYPQPDHIKWWKDNIQCGPLKCQNDSYVTQDGGLLVTNLTANASYHCVAYWSDKIFNASRYHIMVNQSDTYHAAVHPKNVTAKVGERIQFVCVVSGFGQNYSIKWYDNHNNTLSTINHTHVLDILPVQENGSYYCVVSNDSGIQIRTSAVLKVVEPPHIADISDVLVDIYEQDNVTLSCSFTGNPRPTVFWMRVLNKRRLPILQYFNDSTVINETTAILHLSNAVKHLGSYQCIALNEAGYVSRTARVLPKGWTNGVRNLKAEFIDNENYTIKLSWEPPDYDGGVPVHYYKLILYDYSHDASMTVENMLEDAFNGTIYLWDKLEQHSYLGRFRIKFGVIVSDVQKNNRSTIAKTQFLTELELPIHLQVTLMVNCEEINVFTEWELTQRHSLDEIDGYCLKYRCGTSDWQEPLCIMDETKNHTNISGVPTNTTCLFTLTVRSRKEIVSNVASCYRVDSVTSPSTSSSSLYSSIPLSPSPTSSSSSSVSSNTDISTTILLSSSMLRPSMSVSTSYISPSGVHHSSTSNTDISTTILPSSSMLKPSMSLSTSYISPSGVHHSSTSNVNSPTNFWPYIVLVFIFTLLTFLGILAVIFVMRKKNNNRSKLTHEQFNEVHKTFGASDFDDNIKDAVSDTETIIIDGDKLSLFDAMQYCDTEKMYKKIINSNTFDSALSLQSIGSNIDFDNSDCSGQAASSRGCASHYFNPDGVENSSTQTHQYDGGNSIIDNDAGQADEGSSTKMS